MVEAEAIALLYNVSTASSGNENILRSTLTFVASRRGAFFAFLSERNKCQVGVKCDSRARVELLPSRVPNASRFALFASKT